MTDRRRRTIYGLLDPRDGRLRYVGVTVIALRHRLRLHFVQARDREGAKEDWLRELEAAGLAPAIFTLAVVPAGGDWEAAERAWIARMRSSYDLLNRAAGGASATGARHSEETRARHAEATRRAYQDPIERERRRAIVAAAARQPEKRRRLSEAAQRRWAAMTPEKQAALTAAQQAGRAAKQAAKGI